MWYVAGVRVHNGCLDASVPMEQDLFLWSGAYTDCDDKQNSLHVESCILNLMEFPSSNLTFLHPEKPVYEPAGPCLGPCNSLIPWVLEIYAGDHIPAMPPDAFVGKKLVRHMENLWTVTVFCSALAGLKMHLGMETVFLGLFLSGNYWKGQDDSYRVV